MDLEVMKIGATVKVTADGKYVEPLKDADRKLQEVSSILSELFAIHSVLEAKTEYGNQLENLKQHAYRIMETLRDIPRKA